MTVKKALVLAAGKGTRLSSVAPLLPKPLVEVAGTAVLETNLRWLAASGVDEAWVNLHHLGEMIEARISDGRALGLRVSYSREPELLGTAGAAKKLEQELGGGTLLVVYGDNLTSVDLDKMMELHEASGAIATVAVFDPNEVANTGMAGGRLTIDASGRIESFSEGGKDGRFVNAGVYLLEPEVLKAIPVGFSDFGRDIFPALIAGGSTVQAFPIEGYCIAIDTPEALQRAEEIVQDFKRQGSLQPQ